MTNIALPEGLTTIGDSVFSGCSSLTNITLPEGLTTIGYSAFRGCSSLTVLYIPKGTEDYFKRLLPSEYHSMLRSQLNSQS
ncbi:leucine-rich repeat domain-containing protein [uncultured Bacteroides sp.]|uniref:leucine-rich repeat domain-containing protein n=1 Tax=uncultured Bacteroides sp. TaxID=162156 RepID=UPI003456282E